MRCARDGSALVTPAALARSDGDPILGATFGDHAAIELVAVGHVASVYRALDASGAEAALKIARDEPGFDAAALEREASALGAHDRRVVRRLGAGRSMSPPASYLTLDWLPGETLAVCLARAPWSRGAVVLLANDLAEGLAELHRRGVIHADVKPSNVMIGPDGEATLFDLGASVRNGEVAEALTTAYAPPEQRRGEPLDPRADLYALGVVLREALASDGARVSGRGADVQGRSEPLAPSHGALGRLVDRLVALLPEDRPSSAQTVREELSRLDPSARALP